MGHRGSLTPTAELIEAARGAALDWTQGRLARFPNVKLSTQAISPRLPASLLERIKLEANKRDVPYQSLIKVWLSEKISKT